MTEFALEAEAEALRFERERHSIKVSIIEPGPYGTGFNERVAKTKTEWFEGNSLSASDGETIKKEEGKLLSGLYPIDRIVKSIVHAVESPRPKFRYVAPLKCKILVQLLRCLGK